MAMNSDKLAKDILKEFRDNMKKLSSEAKPMDFQEELAKAVAKAVVSVLKLTKTVGITPAPQVASPTSIGKGLQTQPIVMIQSAVSAMQTLLGSQGGIALPSTMSSFMIPISEHLAKNVEVESLSGFGGQGSPPIGAIPLAFEAAILKELPKERVTQMASSSTGTFLIKSLSVGLSTGISLGIPGIIAVGSTPPAAAVLIGRFK